MNRLLIVIALAIAAYVGLSVAEKPGVHAPAVAEHPENADAVLANAFAQRISDLQVAGRGTVSRLLKDDREGRRHQRFLLRLDSGQTLLVSHNIDLAPRIETLKVGDSVEFFGEYEWNAKGGVIHWTHHDPRGRHVGGWLKHNGVLYQ